MSGVDFGSAGAAAGLPLIFFGLISLFFGLKLFKCILFVNGFIIGAAIGGVLGAAAFENNSLALVVALVLGIAGGYVGMMLRRVAYFIFGAILGISAGGALCFFVLSSAEGVPLNTLTGIIAVTAILGGVVACYVGDFIVILCTAALGAFGTTCGSLALFAVQADNAGTKFLLLAELGLLLAVGIWYQLRRREEWKGVLEIHNTTIVNTTVNTNVSTNNTVEVLIQPSQQQYPMMPMTSYPQQYGQPQQYPQQYPSPYPPQQFQPQQEFAKPQAV